jgi:hypothetical protein
MYVCGEDGMTKWLAQSQIYSNFSAVSTSLQFDCDENSLKSNATKEKNDPGRTRTCNPQIRSLVPYPLGHRARLQI